MAKPMIFLDLDGVMADFDAHFPATFGLDHRSLADEAMWAQINAHPSVFRDLPPMPGALDFYREIEPLGPVILTVRVMRQHATAPASSRSRFRHAPRSSRWRTRCAGE